MNNKISTFAFKHLLKDDNTRLIHGVLKSLGISPSRNDYQDLYQEGCLLYVEAYEDFFATHSPEDLELFGPYAFRRIKWRLLDRVRKETNHQEHCKPLITVHSDEADEDTSYPDPLASNFEGEILSSAFFQELWDKCTLQEQAYLANRVAGISITKMSKMVGVSRQAIYKWRDGVIRKAKKILER
ncbi:sigma-70 family RNA polymerase sigma factor [Liquorilactobacillus mali]|uniref:sigma-70 family RNA polymerase sigma factor n=1 Tax=Liquorilactobacillus mali TaxID=1618 RepID=UPI00235048C1|nr:sigma-70 family RNA polymerase sigma factor [Liquorilactobacillus mali]MDC7952210.1 sigma-70 family RNA polymerase sigma factor [Liquorilactobacillus mali]